MNINDVLHDVKRPALRFYWEESQLKGDTLIDSYVGGVPYIEEKVDVLACRGCGENHKYVMQFVIPKKNSLEKTLYSLYYCFECAEKGDVCNFQISVYDNPSETKQYQDADKVSSIFKKRLPISYFVTYELPSYDFLMEEHPKAEEALFDMYGDDAYKIYTELQLKYNVQAEDTGNSVFGIPKELMPSEIPNCPFSNEKMQSFLAITSDTKLGIEWGDEENSMLVILKSPTHNYFQGFII